MNDGMERTSIKHYKDNMSLEGMDQSAKLMCEQFLADQEAIDDKRALMLSLIESIAAQAMKEAELFRGKFGLGVGIAGSIFSIAAGVHAVPGTSRLNPLTKWQFEITEAKTLNPKLMMTIAGQSSQFFKGFGDATGHIKTISDSRVQALRVEIENNKGKMETFKGEAQENRRRSEGDKDRMISMISEERNRKDQTIREVTRAN